MKNRYVLFIVLCCVGQSLIAQMKQLETGKVLMLPGEQQKYQLQMRQIEQHKDTFLVALLQSIKKMLRGTISFVGAESILESAGIVCKAECMTFSQAVAQAKNEAQKKQQNINARDKFGDTALILACAAGDTTKVVRLLRHKAKANIRNFSGHTALMIAAYYGNIEIVQILLALAQDLDIQQQDFRGNTAVYWAIIGDKQAIACLLLRHAKPALDKQYDAWKQRFVVKNLPTLPKVHLQRCS